MPPLPLKALCFGIGGVSTPIVAALVIGAARIDAAPLLSTVAVIATGIAAPSWRLLLAALLISGGARLASLASRA